MNAHEIAILAKQNLINEGHAETWKECKCFSSKDLHLAIEKVLKPLHGK